jgi:hypothetical protein
MTDPARKRSLTADDIAHLASTADIRLIPAGPRASPMSRTERRLYNGVLILILVVSAALYIHIDVKPFLPIQLSPDTAHRVEAYAFPVMALGIIALLALIGRNLDTVVIRTCRRLFPARPRIVCPKCATRTKLAVYLDGRGCSKCKSKAVYCAKCGRPSPIHQILDGPGCSHCGHNAISVV